MVAPSSWVASRADVPCWVRVAMDPATSSKLILFAEAIGSTVDSAPENSSMVILPSPAAVFIAFMTRTESVDFRW
jgi:hypothetical protein